MGVPSRKERRLAYSKYLLTDHWKTLRQEAIRRDGGCVVCGCQQDLQVHHVKYRWPWESCVLGDLETLCRKCHRKEHGLPGDFEEKLSEIRGRILWIDGPQKLNLLPSQEEEIELVKLIEFDDQARAVEALFRQVATLRICSVSERSWVSWLSKSMDVKGRLFWWSQVKLQRIEDKIYVG